MTRVLDSKDLHFHSKVYKCWKSFLSIRKSLFLFCIFSYQLHSNILPIFTTLIFNQASVREMSKSQEYAVLNELLRQDTVADVFDLSNPEAEASQYLWVLGHPGLHRECQDYEVSAHVCMCGEESLKNWNSLLHLLKKKKVHSGSYSAKIKLVDSMKWIQVNKQEHQ